ncbi:MAG: c-type cytochrome [Alphaproteobacteria bacterium]
MTFFKVIGFSLAVILCYTLFANILPQVQSNPPEETAAIDVAALDRSGQIAWGERLFTGKGNCTLCHNDLGRAPDLLKVDLAATFAQRLSDPNYRGRAGEEPGAKAVETYIRESMIEPSAYVVAGFGKKGSNDTVSPMPRVDGAPISLSAAEIDAVIAFLQDKAGSEVTVSLPATADAQAQASADDGGEDNEPARTAEDAIDKFACAACHDLLESGADAGPPLAGVGPRLGRDGIRRAILAPNADLTEGFEPDIMPQDFAEQMRVSELDLVVDYLMALPPRDDAAP